MTRQEILARFPNASESTLRRNITSEFREDRPPTQRATGGRAVACVGGDKLRGHCPKPRMNKLELRFYKMLQKLFPDAHITPQFRLRISSWDAPVQVHYTCDFMLSQHAENWSYLHYKHTLYEVKDSRRKPHSDELTRPKMVKEHNPWISAVILAVWDGQNWTEKQIA